MTCDVAKSNEAKSKVRLAIQRRDRVEFAGLDANPTNWVMSATAT
jgi:hypothetical protein